jgi:DNA-directed RNA polymerase subunit RPC12/RpoP
MAKRGSRLYVCDECKERSLHHWIERNRASRMRCPACGSARLELVSAEARQEQADLNRVRLQGHPAMTEPPARPHKKVT